jgi:putative transcriptional regulator
MQPIKTQPHAYVRPSVWSGHLTLGKFVLTLSMKRQPGQDETAQPIINRLASLRQERGLSHEELAEQLQIHPSTVVAMEKGGYLPSLRLALRVSEVFELPIEAIFFSPATQELTGVLLSGEETIDART